MNILNFIRNKATQAFQSAGNFIDRDPNQSGIQFRNPQPQPPVVQTNNNFTDRIGNDLSNFSGNLGRQIQQDTERFKQQKARPTHELLGMKSPTNLSLLLDATNTVAKYPFNFGADWMGSFGNSLVRASTPEGRNESLKSLQNVLTSKPSFDTLSEPAVEDSLNLVDLATLGGGGLLFGGLKQLDKADDVARAAKPAIKYGEIAAESVPNYLRPVTKEVDELKNLRSGVEGNFLPEIPRINTKKGGVNFISDPTGIIQKTRQVGRNKFNDLLSRIKPTVEEAIDSGKQLPSGEQLRLPQPTQDVSITQLRRLAEAGDNLEGVTVNAKNADEIREALNLGVDSSKINAPSSSRVGGTTYYGTEEGGLFGSQRPLDDLELTIRANKSKFGQEIYKKQNSLRKYVRSVFSGLSDSGEAGKEITRLYKNTANTIDKTAGSLKSSFEQTLKGLSKEEINSFADYIEGRKQIDSPAVQQAVDTYKSIVDPLRQQALEAGLDVGYIENYFPHKINPQNIERELVNAGVDPVAARRRASAFLNRAKERKASFLEFSREFPELDYDKSAKVVFDYIDNAVRRIEHVKNFGKDDSILYQLASQTSDPSQAARSVDFLLEKGDWATAQTGEDVSRLIRSIQTVIKLNPLTSLLNLTQNVNTLAKTDSPSFFRGLAGVISDPDSFYRRATELGEIDPNTVKIFGQDFENSSTTGKYIKLIGMYGTERFNRVMAVAAGENYGRKLLDQANQGSEAAIREIKRLGFDWKPGMTADEVNTFLDDIAKKVSQATQFSAPKGELPITWNSPLGKIITQFRSFAYQQTKLVRDETRRAVSEIAKGNPKPLMNDLIAVGIAAPIVGEIVADIRSVVTNKKRKDMTAIERYVDNIKQGTSLGLIDSLSGLQYGTAGVIGTIGGVTASDLYKGAKATSDVVSGVSNYDQEKSFADNIDPENTTRRFALQNIPTIGRTLSNTFVDNAGIDNLFGGVNEGLTKDKKETYNLLKQTSPDAAQKYKENNQYLDQKGGKSFLSNILGGNKEQESIFSEGMTKAEFSEAKKQVNEVLDNGGIPLESDIKAALFRDKDINSSSIQERTDIYKAINTALENEDYTDEQKQAIIQASGADPKNVEYYSMAAKDVDVKLQEEIIPKLDQMSDEDAFVYLMQARRVIGGKQLLTSTMITYLYERDYISKDQKDALNATKYDEIKDEFYLTKSYGGGGGSKKLSYAQALKAFQVDIPKYSRLKSMDLLFSSPGESSKVAASGEKLLANILSSKPTRSKNSNLWF